MNSRVHTIYPRVQRPIFADSAHLFLFHRELCAAVRMVGEQMEKEHCVAWEGKSFSGDDHKMSANDLEATALIFRYVQERISKSGLGVKIGYLTEEISFVPYPADKRNGSNRHRDGYKPLIYLHVDPIDGSKAFDNWKCRAECPIPKPPSAVSIAALCSETSEIVVSAVYAFDLGEIFSSVYLGKDGTGEPKYAAFRNGTLLSHLASTSPLSGEIRAKRRVLCGNYNSKALVEIAHLELELMKRGLNPTLGGLTGSSATDIINAIRGSFCACIDVRALCGQEGSVPYWYDVAGALPVAHGCVLTVIITNAQGQRLRGGNHPIYQPIAFLVARPEIEDAMVQTIQDIICPTFLVDEVTEMAMK